MTGSVSRLLADPRRLIALIGLGFAGIPFLTTMGVAASVAVAVAAIATTGPSAPPRSAAQRTKAARRTGAHFLQGFALAPPQAAPGDFTALIAASRNEPYTGRIAAWN